MFCMLVFGDALWQQKQGKSVAFRSVMCVPLMRQDRAHVPEIFSKVIGKLEMMVDEEALGMYRSR